MRTRVAIIGAGPAGLLLSQLLHNAGIESAVLERRDRVYVESRIRAGVLEPGSVALLEEAGAGERLRREGMAHKGVNISADGELLRIDFAALAGGSVTVYGQTQITRDLIAASFVRHAPPVFEASGVALHDIENNHPFVTYEAGGRTHRLDCEFIAGCDGQHGTASRYIPASVRQISERTHPFGWLGIMADVAPCHDELIYASHARGFALASQRSRTRSRYYIQVPIDESVEAWPDERLWDELALRLGPAAAARMTRGTAIEKSIAPLRSCTIAPMRHGRLFLAGDAAHIVPPTGAKGLNLALADAGSLARALIRFYEHNDSAALETYSAHALRRVGLAERFSWWFTQLTHRFTDTDAFDRPRQMAELDRLRQSRAAQTRFAQNYIGDWPP